MTHHPIGLPSQRNSLRGAGRRFALAALGLLLLAACSSPEEKQAQHLTRGIALYGEGSDDKAMIELRNVLHINPKNAEAIYYVGLIHERAQRWAEAYGAYQAAASEDPGMIKAQVKLGTLSLLSNDLDAANQAAAAIEKIDPNNPDGLAIKGAIALRQGETQQAIDLAKTALARDDGNENSVGVYVGALSKLGQTDRAIEFADASIAKHPDSAALRLLKVNLLEKMGDRDAVRAAYDDLINHDPGNEGYRLAFATFLQSDDPQAAEAVLRDTVEGASAGDRSTAFLVQLIRKTRGFEAADQELRAQIAHHPDNYALRFRLADLNAQEGKNDVAEAELKNLADRAGDDQIVDDARAALAQLALMRKDNEAAKQIADQVITHNGEHRGANLIRALVALQEDKLEDVIRYARAALRRDPSWLPALKLVAEAHYRRGELDLAVDALNDIVNADPTDTKSAQALATLLTQRGDYDSALKIWDLVLAHATDKGQALRSRAQIALRQQKWSAAQQDINELLKTPGDAAAGALLAGDLMIAQNRFDQGREWFEKAQAMQPQAPEPVIGVVRSYLAQNQPDRAVAFLTQHTATNPSDAIAFSMLGELGGRQGKLDAALAAYTKSIELQPGWAVPRRQMAALLVGAGRLDEALAVLKSANDALPDNVDVLNDLAGILINTNHPLEAIAMYGNVLRIQPDSEVAINNMAALTADFDYQNSANLDRTLSLASRFRTSTNAYFLDTLGWLYYRKGDYAVAATYVERAINLKTDRADMRYHLGMALAKGGQKERAILELRKATQPGGEAYHGFDEARATLSQLEAEARSSVAPIPAAAGGDG